MKVYRVEIDFGGIVSHFQAENFADAFDLVVQNEVDIGAYNTLDEAREQVKKEVTQIRELTDAEIADRMFFDDADEKSHVMSEWVAKNPERGLICSTEY